MKVQIIKREIPEGISEQGGCSLQIVNKETVDLETSIDEAKDQLCVVGDRLLIKGQFAGLFKSMVAGIQRDGNARTLGDFLTLYPVPTGEIDLEKGWDPAVNGVRIRARLLNEMELDISKWEFEDVTPGRQAFTVESVQGGAVTGVIQNGCAVAVNGKNLPTANGRVEWALPELGVSGTLPAGKVTMNATRCDIASDAFDEIITPSRDGKPIDLTIRGNCANAKISALLKYVPVIPTITSVTQTGRAAGVVAFNTGKLTVRGEGLKIGADMQAFFEMQREGVAVTSNLKTEFTVNTDTLLETNDTGFNNNSSYPDGEWEDKEALLVLVKGGVRYTYPVTFAL